jgi:hypothetical protein
MTSDGAPHQVLADLFNLMDTAEPDFDVGGEQL